MDLIAILMLSIGIPAMIIMETLLVSKKKNFVNKMFDGLIFRKPEMADFLFFNFMSLMAICVGSLIISGIVYGFVNHSYEMIKGTGIVLIVVSSIFLLWKTKSSLFKLYKRNNNMEKD